MLLQGLSTERASRSKKKTSKKTSSGKTKSKVKKVTNHTIEQQIESFAQIIVHQLFTELGLHEKE